MIWLIAVVTLLVLPLPVWLASLGLALCLIHGVLVLPSRILLSHEAAWRGLRHDEDGWSLWSRRSGWQPVQLYPDSLALPLAVILRFKVPGHRFAQGLCLPRDAMSREHHRRLRVRLKFSRRRWVAPE